MKNKYFLPALLFCSILGNAQETELKTDSLKEVVVTSSRIDLPFKENSRTVLVGLTGQTDNFIYQGKLHLVDFVDENNLKNSDQQAEHYVWKPYMDRILKRFVNLTKYKGYKPPEKAEFHFSETIQVK